MAKLILRAGRSERDFVAEPVNMLEFGLEVEFIPQAPPCRYLERFAAAWMAATAVGPVAAPQAFFRRPSLHKQPAFVIKKEQRESTVQYAIAIVRLGLGQEADFAILPVYEYEFFSFG